jgi:hypothetical protein
MLLKCAQQDWSTALVSPKIVKPNLHTNWSHRKGPTHHVPHNYKLGLFNAWLDMERMEGVHKGTSNQPLGGLFEQWARELMVHGSWFSAP